jgi:hypothetical protein
LTRREKLGNPAPLFPLFTLISEIQTVHAVWNNFFMQFGKTSSDGSLEQLGMQFGTTWHAVWNNFVQFGTTSCSLEQLLIKVSARLIDFCPTSTTEY